MNSAVAHPASNFEVQMNQLSVHESDEEQLQIRTGVAVQGEQRATTGEGFRVGLSKGGGHNDSFEFIDQTLIELQKQRLEHQLKHESSSKGNISREVVKLPTQLTPGSFQ